MSLRQKFIAVSFTVFILILLIPSVIPAHPVGRFVKTNTYGIAAFYVFLLCAIRISKNR